MSWLTRLRKWWECTQTPLPSEETVPAAPESELEDDPDVKVMKQAVETQITELLRANPRAGPRIEQAKREAEREASRWLEIQRRVWAGEREPHEQRSEQA